MDGGSTPSRALVQNAGRGYRLPAAFAKQQFEKTGDALIFIRSSIYYCICAEVSHHD
jgi:hypothetical protein